MRYKIIFLMMFFSMVGASFLKAQELQCMVQVVAPSVQGTNRGVFETLQTSIIEFMNGQQWTDHVFKSEERIDCSILINIREVVGNDEFKGSIQIQSRRPVYNSSYSSPLINYLDQDFDFSYVEFEPLVYNPNNIESNLVAVLAYYAYVIIGFDYDSFSEDGGTPYFKLAENIVNVSQNSTYSGWKSFESTRNRYWLIENLLNENHSNLRTCFYQYHRQGMDILATKPEEGRSNILSSVELLQRVYRQQRNSFALSFFFDAKTEEILNIFSNAYSMEKGRIVNVLSEIDPSNVDKYQNLLNDN